MAARVLLPEHARDSQATRVVPCLAAAALVTIALLLAALILPPKLSLAAPRWLIHPDETGYLISAKHLAETGSFFKADAWAAETPAHVPQGTTLVDGDIVPRKAIGGYLIYALAFLVSDGAWLYVGPLFGLLTGAAAGVLVYQATQNLPASVGAMLVTITASPLLAFASGLAFADVIAVAFMLWGLVALQMHLRSAGPWYGIMAGASLGFAFMVRYDFVVAAALAGLAVAWQGHRSGEVRSTIVRSLPGGAAVIACGLALVATHWALYNDPLSTGYAEGWQESPAGVAGSFLGVSPAAVLDLARSYMLEIGMPMALLLAVGGAGHAYSRRFDAAIFVLLGFSLFCIVYYLGRPGAYGTNTSWLVASFPRYIMAAYVAGAVLGMQALAVFMRRAGTHPVLAAGLIAAVTVLACAWSLREAETNVRGLDYTWRLSNTHRIIADVADQTPRRVVVVSDLNSKAILNADTITPFEAAGTGYDVVADVKEQLGRGAHVIVVGDQRSHPLYSGYVEALHAAGLEFVARRCTVEVYEVYLPGERPAVVTDCPDRRAP